MTISPPSSIATLRGPLLRSVSRSFFLSIRLLPASVRDPIALAYLLARATDTIADTTQLEAKARMAHLARLARLIQGERDQPEATSTLVQSFAPLQHDLGERALIEQLPACLDWLAAIEEEDRADIRRVLKTVNQGQALDAERFGDTSRVTALANAAQLDEYTYLVAGCVGEFWTRVCFRHVRRFAILSEPEMIALGVTYGKALQLTNILRDAGADLRAGRCYLPVDELHSLGVRPEDLQSAPTLAEPVARQWRQRTTAALAGGVEYACAIRPWRVRFATALPVLIGARTIALLNQAGPAAFEGRIKVSRAEVRRIIFRMARSFASPAAIRHAFAQPSSRASADGEGPHTG